MDLRLGALGFFVVALLVIGVYLFAASPSDAITDCTTGRALNVVAHPDDDLVFQNPDIQHDIRAGKCIQTVYVTAADDAKGLAFAEARQKGVEAAYAEMARVSNDWFVSQESVAGHQTEVARLRSDPKITLRFMWLPDGDPLGSGMAAHRSESLEKLWNGDISEIHLINSGQTYTKQSLTETLRVIMEEFKPNLTRTLDYAEQFGPNYSSYSPDWDHSDHLAVGRFVFIAHREYNSSPNSNTLLAYVGSGTGKLMDISGADLKSKVQTFYTYSKFDTSTGCSSDVSCNEPGGRYPRLLQREYLAATDVWMETNPGDTIGTAKLLATPVRVYFEGALYRFYYSPIKKDFNVDRIAGEAITSTTLDDSSRDVGSASAALVFDNTLHVFYYDRADGTLKHAWSTDGGTWRFERLDRQSDDVGNYPTAIGYLQEMRIFFYDATIKDLLEGKFDGKRWSFFSIDGSSDSVSRRPSDTGIYPSANVTDSDLLHLDYYDLTGQPREAWLGGGGWHFVTRASRGISELHPLRFSGLNNGNGLR